MKNKGEKMNLMERFDGIEREQREILKGLAENTEFSELVEAVAYDSDKSYKEKCSEQIMQRIGILSAIDEALDGYEHKLILAGVNELEGAYYGLTFVAIWLDDGIKTRSFKFLYQW
jgi:hypothetical protein